ncbi:hypothetical protein CIL05_07375 [Virgibacillus profundi]|uniref:Uncharacterized protein n=1 Tax=Virgibacillus profundi TaxID=2024555 RepID=A0A2A2IE47_9BACI|nr:hypothetical protein [Virgibacillus profundi]PAV30281.1 hypothetical protein CIL05_07375 [Virgibacillus profundi]PXY54453.1 hypothetical protein CIT14_07460 [Virgibacillus profundi]
MTMKVYKMNNIENVAANSAEEAKQFYAELCGYTYDEVQEDFEGEVDLQTKMLVDVKDLPDDVFIRVNNLEFKYGTAWAYMTFQWVLENDLYDDSEPFVISSTEH